MKKVGFQYVELVGETGFNSTPKTKGVLVRATKSEQSSTFFQSSINEDQTAHKIVALDSRAPQTLEAVVEKAYALGCEEAKIIDTKTVVVEKWVRWKCLYGCPMYNKDGCHPPYAPDADETKEVLSEYTKAILLKGPKGKELTDIAVNLEGEAYKIGFYKAFALTALPSGGEVESAPGAT